MPPVRFPGPCEKCGRIEPSGYYKDHLCNMCYKRRSREGNERKRMGPPKTQLGPCNVCGSDTSSNGRFIRGMCSACYKRVILRQGAMVARQKFNGPCTRCGKTDPSLKYNNKMCPRCYKWIRNNICCDNANHRARKVGIPLELSPEQWEDVLEFYEYHCAYCGKDIQRSYTIDHVIPMSKGGSHAPSNVVPACLKCNGRKKDKTDMKPLKRYIPKSDT